MESYLSVAALLIGVGIAALVAEFLAPSGGLLVVVSFAAFAAGVGLILLYGSRSEAVVAIIGLCVGIPAMTYAVMTGYKRMALKSALDAPEGESAPEAFGAAGLAALKGQYGTASSPLRPYGVAVFGGQRVDAMSDGGVVEAGASVKCVGVRGTTVTVRPAAAPKGPLEDIVADDFV